jgi:hypothetical protein
VRFGLTSASFDTIGGREHHNRNYARIGLRSEVIGERSEAIIASFAGIDATCVTTFVIFDETVATHAEVKGTTKYVIVQIRNGGLPPLRLIRLQCRRLCTQRSALVRVAW